jgi:predicted aminopeptidase
MTPARLFSTSSTRTAPVRLKSASALAALLAGLSGCSPTANYVLHQAAGQLQMMARCVPIEQVLASGQLNPEKNRKLMLVVEARNFARDRLHLRVGNSFTLYHETAGRPVAYNLSAARKDALVPRRWHFPLIGTLDYIGFFYRAEAEATARQLEREGYDTLIYPVDAYSTLGWFPDPVHSSFLDRSDGTLVETVIHELAHNTVYAPGQSTFNETLATFVGRQGARLFFNQRGDDGARILQELQRDYLDADRIADWMNQLLADLNRHYARNISTTQKIQGREAIFQAARDRFVREVQPNLFHPDRYAAYATIPTNNAYVLLHRRYHFELQLFDAAYHAVGEDFARFLEILKAAAAADDPFAWLRGFVNSPERTQTVQSDG